MNDGVGLCALISRFCMPVARANLKSRAARRIMLPALLCAILFYFLVPGFRSQPSPDAKGVFIYVNDALEMGCILLSNGTTFQTHSILKRLPKTHCRWELGRGTRGQSSSVFYMNRTYMFLIQEICTDSRGRTFAVAGMISFSL
jgi:hypothetical protein